MIPQAVEAIDDNEPFESVSLIRIDRLRIFYPVERLEDILGLRPDMLVPGEWPYEEQSQFVGEFHPDRQDDAYHVGRIRYFVRIGIEEPIEIDNKCAYGRILPIPLIIDGHHRYWAALIRGDTTIPCLYSGRVDLMDWLTGKTDDYPCD